MDHFVNRESELAVLAGLVRLAAAGSGTLISVRGQQGIGKTSLLRVLPGIPGPGGAVFYSVSCHAQVGELQSYGPFLALLTQIDESRPRSRLRRLAGQAARTAGPELLNLVPGLGPLLKSAAETVAGAVPGAPTVDPTAAAHLVTQAVLDAVRRAQPAVVVVDDAHHIDASSCAVLSYLAEAVTDLPILIILLSRDDHENRVFTDLLDELYIRDRLHKLELRGLEAHAVAQFAHRVADLELEPQRAQELATQTAGHPLTLRFYLGEGQSRRELTATADRPLETAPIGSQTASVRTKLTALIRMRLNRLAESDRRLLAIGAVQGERFLSTVVAAVAGMNADNVDTALHRLARDTHLIVDDPAGVSMSAESDGYRFEHGLLQQTLYEDQSSGQRRRRHGRIATELAALTEEPGPPTLELLLEIARHSRAAGAYASAARSAHGAACHLAGVGTSIREVASICRQGIDDLEHAAPDREVYRLRALLIELLLAATELSWTADRGPDDTNPIETLAQTAITSADRSDDADLKVRVRYLYGKVLLYTQGLHHALDPLREAWEAARESGDAVSVLLAGCEYGRQLPKTDVAEGLNVLSAAEQVAENDPGILHSNDPVVIRARDMVALQVGINLMDAGQLGPALDKLHHAVAVVRQRGTLGLLPIGLNYLAQAELATGGVDDAERLLQEAAALPGDREGGAWDAVNLAYLGWLTVVRRGDESGFALLDRARIRSTRLWQANLAPLVANLHAAALLEGCRLSESTAHMVRAILDETIAETRRTGMLRSEVLSLSLLSRLHMATGDLDGASRASQAAVDHLRNANWALAAVNTEEILAHHAVVLRECGDPSTAKAIIRRAAAEVRRKARSVPDDRRERFSRDVPVNRLVADTMKTLSTQATRRDP